jgi:hypothetical protein
VAKGRLQLPFLSQVRCYSWQVRSYCAELAEAEFAAMQ